MQLWFHQCLILKIFFKVIFNCQILCICTLLLIGCILNSIKKWDILMLSFLHILLEEHSNKSFALIGKKQTFSFDGNKIFSFMKDIRMQIILISWNKKKLVISLVHGIRNWFKNILNHFNLRHKTILETTITMNKEIEIIVLYY